VAIGKKYPESFRDLILIRKVAATIVTIIPVSGFKKSDIVRVALRTKDYIHIPEFTD
jgi:hypothetical protein